MQSSTQDIQTYMQQLGETAVEAARVVARSPSQTRDNALLAIADAIEQNQPALQEANSRDMANGRERGLQAALLDRLELTPARIAAMADGLRQIARQPDPVGEVTNMAQRPSGLRIGQMRVPLGVIGIIYESRPNVTADAAALCLKAGNAAILRGGSEAIHSNLAISVLVHQGLREAGLPEAAVQVVNTSDRAAVDALLALDGWVDVIVPRGGKGLIERVANGTRIPVIKHLDGICHVYVDEAADLDKAVDVAVNSKTYRYGICGAMETLLVSSAVAESFLPKVAAPLRDKGVELRGCARVCALLDDAQAANEQDWQTEYLAPVLSIRVVDNIEQAIAHIERYGSHHTDAIVTERLDASNRFLREVDSASVMVNAATCFADGNEYGLGAEIGISTGKLHVRGPVGAAGLTTQKFVVFGDGTTRG